MIHRLLPVLLLAACAQSNKKILKDLGRQATAEPKPAYEALLAEPLAPVPLAAPPVRASLPMVRGRVPTVMGRVNGVEMPIVLDTGTTHVMISGEGARLARVYLPEDEPVTIVSPGYTSSHRVCVFDSIELGGNRFGAGVATIPIEKRKTPQWTHLSSRTYAIVGCAILSYFRVTFDFRQRQVRLVPHGRKASTELIHAPVEINGRRFNMLVDSGATNVVIEPWAALDLGLITSEQARWHRREAKNEHEVAYSYLDLETLRVEDQTFGDVAVVSTQTFGREPTDDGHVIAGLLALRAFGRRVWTVDYGRRRLLPE